jgi:hypothetical protein
MSPPHLKITPPDGGGYPPSVPLKSIAKKLVGKDSDEVKKPKRERLIDDNEDKKMYSDIITDTIIENRCPKGTHW